jgi:integrase
MLTDDLARYVALHHALGFKFRIQQGLLKNYVAFAEAAGDDAVRADRAMAWASMAPSAPQRRNRLLTVRRFALAMHAENARHEVPAADAVGRPPVERRRPHIYSAGEVIRLMRAAAELSPAGTLRPRTYATLFGLLAITGLRISEALALRLGDYVDDGLVVRQTKFRKSRLLPLHATTRQALDVYIKARGSVASADDHLFLSNTGTSPAYSTVIAIFLSLARAIGLRGGPGEPGPCIHDLRHSFAVRSLEACNSDSHAVARHVVGLSTYLGHAHVTDTYWYLHATPLLMTRIASAGERLYRGGAS